MTSLAACRRHYRPRTVRPSTKARDLPVRSDRAKVWVGCAALPPTGFMLNQTRRGLKDAVVAGGELACRAARSTAEKYGRVPAAEPGDSPLRPPPNSGIRACGRACELLRAEQSYPRAPAGSSAARSTRPRSLLDHPAAPFSAPSPHLLRTFSAPCSAPPSPHQLTPSPSQAYAIGNGSCLHPERAPRLVPPPDRTISLSRKHIYIRVRKAAKDDRKRSARVVLHPSSARTPGVLRVQPRDRDKAAKLNEEKYRD
jgi:hypothetical protein